MKRLLVACLSGLALLVGGASAQEFNNNPMGDKQYTCDFLPTDTIRAGYVYRVKDMIKFPAGATEKLFPVEGKFEIAPGAGGKTGAVAGVRTKRVYKIGLKAAAELYGKSDVEIGGQASRKVKIERAVDNHNVHFLYDSEVAPAKDWFKQFKKTSGYEKSWQYFLVREIRYADGMSYIVSKELAAELGGSGKLTQVADAEVVAETVSESSIELQTVFAAPSVFCMKVERLK